MLTRQAESLRHKQLSFLFHTGSRGRWRAAAPQFRKPAKSLHDVLSSGRPLRITVTFSTGGRSVLGSKLPGSRACSAPTWGRDMSRPYMTNGAMRGKIRWFHHSLSERYWG